MVSLSKMYLQKYGTDASTAAADIHDGMTIAMSGYAMAGYPKAIPLELASRCKNGEQIKIHLITGSNLPFLDDVLGKAGAIARRTPMCASKALAKQVNAGSVHYTEQQMSKMPRLIKSGHLGKIDIVVVEAMDIIENGIVPTSSIGMTEALMNEASEIIIELNRGTPEILKNLHDVYSPQTPPDTKPVPIINMSDRIGEKFIPINWSKVKYIVETNLPEWSEESAHPVIETSEKIVGNLMSFLKTEYPVYIPPIQTGFGGLADEIAGGFEKSDISGLRFFCGGVTDPLLKLLILGKADCVSTGGITMSQETCEALRKIPDLERRLIIRSGEITNSAEVIGRLGVIAVNTGIEMDIYGNINSSHIGGNRVVNGIGGGAGFAENSGLSVVVMSSSGKNGNISRIVPMVSHQDICEHDVDVVITENGIADLRGMDDTERAVAIISNCSDKRYKDQLLEYLDKAKEKSGGHHPQNPVAAFEWYTRLKEKGTMMVVREMEEP